MKYAIGWISAELQIAPCAIANDMEGFHDLVFAKTWYFI